MKPHFKIFSAFVLLLSAACTPSDELAVRNKELEIRWEQTAEGWKISRVADRKGRCWGVPDGAYTILFSSEKPSAEPETITNRGGDTMNFDIARFHYIAKDFNRAVSSVPMNRAGEALRFYPEKAGKRGAPSASKPATNWAACARHGVPTRIIRRTYASKACSTRRARGTIR